MNTELPDRHVTRLSCQNGSNLFQSAPRLSHGVLLVAGLEQHHCILLAQSCITQPQVGIHRTARHQGVQNFCRFDVALVGPLQVPQVRLGGLPCTRATRT